MAELPEVTPGNPNNLTEVSSSTPGAVNTVWGTSENYLRRSEDFDVSPWSASGATVQADQNTNPIDGEFTADLVSSSGATGDNVSQTLQLAASGPDGLTFSVYVKSSVNNLVALEVEGSISGNADSVYEYNLSTLAITHKQGYSGATTGIIDVGNGWYRCFIFVTGSVINKVYIYNGFDVTFTVNLNYWGAQVNRGGLAPYVATGSTPIITNFYSQLDGPVDLSELAESTPGNPNNL